MTVLEPSELQASPLADLHAIADQLGLDGYRRLRKAELIDAILAGSGSAQEGSDEPDPASPQGASSERRRRPARSRRPKAPAAQSSEADANGRASEREEKAPASKASEERTGEGVVELLGNGSAFLRVHPPEPTDEDVYISAAQVRRCELVSGDRVTGPVRTPRRSERYPSLIRIDTINGASADSVAESPRFDELTVSHPSERLELDAKDPTLKAIEWLTPIGRGSRALIVGSARAGKTETLRLIAGALAGSENLELMLVLAGVRPEEIADWGEGPLAPVAALNFAASADSQGQAVERAIENAKRVAARGGDALVLIDTLDGLHPQSARKALASARNLSGAGSVTVIATASRAYGGESTVIALDLALTSTGRLPALDLMASGTLKAELLVGEDGAHAIAQARAARASD
ncbi:MAG TPA: Rho termination factor N-terminal domain-containing protein [Solirubrobacteraceae bacterium]